MAAPHFGTPSSEDVLHGNDDVELQRQQLRRPEDDYLFRRATDIEGPGYHGAEDNWRRTLHLAFQCIGVIYGDIGTSPLYVYSSTFPNGIGDSEDILGALSLIIYTIILLPMIKYVFIVLWANDNGDGGTFALYSLISRYARISLIPNQQAEDALVSTNKIEPMNAGLRRAHWLKEKLQTSTAAKIFLFFLAILGTSMVIGDGVLTPAISVVSAVGGLQQKAPQLDQNAIVWISVAILVVLFAFQPFGTDKVGYTFAPIVSVWFLFIAGIGLYNLIRYDVSVLKAFNPAYIGGYFQRNGFNGWVSLGGIVLCITGTEAMFADLGHFNIRAVQISFTFFLFPAVMLAYIGQAAYLRIHPGDVLNVFYLSIPDPLFWPQFIVAVLAAIIASQAMISGAFAIIAQSQTLGCFPRVKVMHTSNKYEGQVFIPEINFVLAVLTVIITFALQNSTNIGNAYGICVVFVMTITTILLSIVMLLIWRLHVLLVALFFVVFGLVELVFLSSVLYKFTEFGYVPFCIAFVFLVIMAIWHYVHVKRYYYEMDHTVRGPELLQLAEQPTFKTRMPGVAVLYTELVQGVPPIFSHLVDKIPSLHNVIVFLSVKHLPVPFVREDERFLVLHVQPASLRMYRCVVRYGYNDRIGDANQLAFALADRLQLYLDRSRQAIESEIVDFRKDAVSRRPATVHVEPEMSTMISNSNGDVIVGDVVSEEQEYIKQEIRRRVVYMIGESEVVATPGSNIFKILAVDYLYNFLKKNFRQGDKAFDIPREQLLKIGVTYAI